MSKLSTYSIWGMIITIVFLLMSLGCKKDKDDDNGPSDEARLIGISPTSAIRGEGVEVFAWGEYLNFTQGHFFSNFLF